MPPLFPPSNANAPEPHIFTKLASSIAKRATHLTTPPSPQFAYLNAISQLPTYTYVYMARASNTLTNLVRRIPLPSSPPHLSTSDSVAKRSMAEDSSHILRPRQNAPPVAIPTVYQGLNSGPSPGTVVGIVLGSVVGFILLVWFFMFLFQANQSTIESDSVHIERRRSRSPRSSRHTRSRRTRSEVREVSRSPRTERVIVEERRREVSREPPVVIRETVREPPVIVREERREERRVEGDDIIEVTEEQSDITPEPAPPRRKSSGTRRSSGYRSVDPNQYGGGDYAQREIYSSRGSRRY
ncbi:MAG: hypothetical protein M1820_009381 [Bogoriella megaspora]|nr:MAG: hypothetical protein M1820_009381 [Bogoriella megaspora]